jgi:Dinitrogenase iron-molybdenum cofactor
VSPQHETTKVDSIANVDAVMQKIVEHKGCRTHGGSGKASCGSGAGQCQGGYGEEDSLETIIRAINDCHAVFVAKIGGCPKSDLIKAGIEPVDQFAHEFIEKSAIAWFKAYLDKVKSGEITHVQRGDAEIRQGALIAAA